MRICLRSSLENSAPVTVFPVQHSFVFISGINQLSLYTHLQYSKQNVKVYYFPFHIFGHSLEWPTVMIKRERLVFWVRSSWEPGMCHWSVLSPLLIRTYRKYSNKGHYLNHKSLSHSCGTTCHDTKSTCNIRCDNNDIKLCSSKPRNFWRKVEERGTFYGTFV